jgi:hypothetical protein
VVVFFLGATRLSNSAASRSLWLNERPSHSFSAVVMTRRSAALPYHGARRPIPIASRRRCTFHAAKGPRNPFQRCARVRAAVLRRRRIYNADEPMSEIVAKRLVEHLQRSGFVLMKRPPIGGGAALGRGLEGLRNGG